MKRFCTKCGNALAVDTAFCDNCGAPTRNLTVAESAETSHRLNASAGQDITSATGLRPGAIVLGLLSLAIGLAVMTTVRYIFTPQALLGFGFIVVGLVAVVRGMGKRITWW